MCTSWDKNQTMMWARIAATEFHRRNPARLSLWKRYKVICRWKFIPPLDRRRQKLVTVDDFLCAFSLSDCGAEFLRRTSSLLQRARFEWMTFVLLLPICICNRFRMECQLASFIFSEAATALSLLTYPTLPTCRWSAWSTGKVALCVNTSIKINSVFI